MINMITDLEKIEQGVLGAIMVENALYHENKHLLNAGMFGKPIHQKIFETIQEIPAFDLLVVTKAMRAKGLIGAEKHQITAVEITKMCDISIGGYGGNFEYYIYLLKEAKIRREVEALTVEYNSTIKDGTQDVFETLHQLRNKLDNVEIDIDSGPEQIGSVAEKAVNGMLSGDTSGLSLGFRATDAICKLKPGLIILAARPGMGKTALALQIKLNMAMQGHTVLMFSLEMSANELSERMLSNIAGVPSFLIERRKLQDSHYILLDAAQKKMKGLPLYVDDTATATVEMIRAKAYAFAKKCKQNGKPLDCIIIDYLQLMGSSEKSKNGTRENEVSTISRALKLLSKELQVPVICLSQLSRAVETRGGDKKPQLSDLRESGAIEQDADKVIFIYRPEYYKMEEDADGNPLPKGFTLLDFAKNRNGALGAVSVKADLDYMKFTDFIGE